MTSKDGQANVTKAAFRLGINNIERTKDMLKNKTSMRMTFRSNRNEMYRAQTQIDKIRKSFEAIEGDMIANPTFRKIDKSAWVDQKRPFRVLKADKKILSRLSDHEDTESATITKEPYREPLKQFISKKVDDRYIYPPKKPETDWSPKAVVRRAETSDSNQQQQLSDTIDLDNKRTRNTPV